MEDKSIYGLSSNSLKRILGVFNKFNDIEKVILFGSRAESTFREGSDIDIAILGNINFDTILKIRVKLDDLNMPYKIDLIDYNSIDEPKLKVEIDKNGIILFERVAGL